MSAVDCWIYVKSWNYESDLMDIHQNELFILYKKHWKTEKRQKAESRQEDHKTEICDAIKAILRLVTNKLTSMSKAE
ncbi:CLUMA_CG008213, isoform A [Clunio marinus]|uniref:CLUMA_CG008213, isoform A n=1 Tax=Clunio marinus TaxID=568069 RepID=A0A1J1I8H0_9DIPT|nr:CLUMA_CG008213, isoform A [Clunio marinus]